MQPNAAAAFAAPHIIRIGIIQRQCARAVKSGQLLRVQMRGDEVRPQRGAQIAFIALDRTQTRNRDVVVMRQLQAPLGIAMKDIQTRFANIHGNRLGIPSRKPREVFRQSACGRALLQSPDAGFGLGTQIGNGARRSAGERLWRTARHGYRAGLRQQQVCIQHMPELKIGLRARELLCQLQSLAIIGRSDCGVNRLQLRFDLRAVQPRCHGATGHGFGAGSKAGSRCCLHCTRCTRLACNIGFWAFARSARRHLLLFGLQCRCQSQPKQQSSEHQQALAGWFKP